MRTNGHEICAAKRAGRAESLSQKAYPPMSKGPDGKRYRCLRLLLAEVRSNDLRPQLIALARHVQPVFKE